MGLLNCGAVDEERGRGWKWILFWWMKVLSLEYMHSLEILLFSLVGIYLGILDQFFFWSLSQHLSNAIEPMLPNGIHLTFNEITNHSNVVISQTLSWTPIENLIFVNITPLNLSTHPLWLCSDWDICDRRKTIVVQ
jgi:hypothetical protein